MWLLAFLGAAVAGLIMMLRPLSALLGAQATGVIRTYGQRGQRIARASDPERFHSVCRTRWREMGPGAIVLLVGTLLTAMQATGMAIAMSGG